MADPKTDAKITAGASATVAPPAPPPAPVPAAETAAAKPEEKKTDEKPSDIKLDSKSVYIAPEFLWTWRGFGNSTEDVHKGPGFGITASYPNILFGDRFYLRPEFQYRKEWVSRSIPAEFGKGIESSASIDHISPLGFAFGAKFHPLIGMEVGGRWLISHLGAVASTDGKEGIRYQDNRFAYSADNWGHSFEGRLGLVVPEQQVAPWLQLGGKVFGFIGHTSWDLTPDSVSRSPSDPPIGVGSTYGGFGLAVAGRFGDAPKPYKTSTEEPKKDAPVPAPTPAPTAAPAAPQGVKDIQAMVDPMKAKVKEALEMKFAENAAGYAKTVADKASSKKKDDQAVALDTAKLAIQESQKAGAAYKVATEAVGKAEAALAELKKDTKISPEHMKLAEEAVASMKVEADKLKEESHKAWESAGAAVKSYNSIKGLPKKEQIEFKDEDPAKPAAAAVEVKVEDKPQTPPKTPPKNPRIE
jgi:hypothetical protein